MKLSITVDSQWFTTNEGSWFFNNPLLLDWTYPMPHAGDLFDLKEIAPDYPEIQVESYHEFVFSVDYVKWTRRDGEIICELNLTAE